MARLFTEADLATLGRERAVVAMREFLADAAAGEAHSPPRQRVSVGARDLVFTVGGSARQDMAGFRLYSIGSGTAEPSQMLGLLRLSTGEILATAVGDAFGAWRTAALGAVAMQEGTRHLDRRLVVAVLGAGFQAGHHTRTWAAVKKIGTFRVWARRAEQSRAFAAQLHADTDVPATAARTTADAVQGADAILCVTASPTPVIDASDLPASAYVATVGPKFGGRHELPAEAYARADFLFTDAPAQALDYERTRGPLPGGRRASKLVDLAAIVAGEVAPPADGLRLFVSEGLSGTEVALLAAVRDALG